MKALRIAATVGMTALLSVGFVTPVSALTSQTAGPSGNVSDSSIDLTNVTLDYTSQEAVVTFKTSGTQVSPTDPSFGTGPLSRNIKIDFVTYDNYKMQYLVAGRQASFTDEYGEAVPCGVVGATNSADNSTFYRFDSSCLGSPYKLSAQVTMSYNGQSDSLTTAVTQPGGRYLLGADGGVFSFGNAPFYGSTGDKQLNAPVLDLVTNPISGGYWLVAADGGIFTFGPNNQFYGSTGNKRLNAPVLTMAVTPSGKGYWLIAADGGVFTFGDAKFYGSTGDKKLNAPIIAMKPTPSGSGYWLFAEDGGVFTFGDAKFYGSTGDKNLAAPIVDMENDGASGYTLLAADGGIFNFGSAAYHGSGAEDGFTDLGLEAVALIGEPGGYTIASSTGLLVNYGSAFDYGNAEQGVSDHGSFVLADQYNAPFVSAVAAN